MRYTYEFEFYPEEDYLLAIPFDFEGGTFGETPEDAVESAVDWLTETINDYLLKGKILPPGSFLNAPKHGGRIVSVSVDTELDNIETVTAHEAASLLGVSKARVSQLIKVGLLDSYTRGRSVFVTRESIKARLKDKPTAGRPSNSSKDVPSASISSSTPILHGS